MVRKYKEPTRNNAIDILRIIAALAVIYIHVHSIGVALKPGSLPVAIDSVLMGIARLAVPLFFAISGWFLFSPKRQDRVEKSGKQIKRLIGLYLTAYLGTVVAYFFFGRILGLPQGGGHIGFPGLPDIINIVFIGSGGGVLWFLSSLIIIELIYHIIFRATDKENWLLAVTPIGLIVVLLTVTYSSVTHVQLALNPESWFVAIAFFSLGYFLHKFYPSMIATVRTRSLIRYTAVVGLLYAYEYVLHTSGAPFIIGPYNYLSDFIMIPFLVAGLILLTTRISGESVIATRFASIGRNYSLIIYIVHPIIISGVLFSIYQSSGIFADHQFLKITSAYAVTVVVAYGGAVAYTRLKRRVAVRLATK